MRCAKCGAENPAGLKFCNECAAPFGRRCVKCGFENAPTAKFCGECAAPLGVAEGSGKAAALAGSAPANRFAAEPAEASSIEGEPKTATALFADIKGSTHLQHHLNPEDPPATIYPP